MKAAVAAVTLAAALFAPAGHADSLTTLEALAAATVVTDVASTRYALDRGARELNPLLGDHPSNTVLITAAAVRIAAVLAIGELLPRADAERALRVISCLQLGVTANNLAADRDPAVRFEAFTIGVMIPFALTN